MMAVLIVGNSGVPFATNVSMLLICLALGLVVPHAATVIHRLRGWRRVSATVAMNVAAVLLVLAVAHPQAVIKAAALMECYCWWGWESWCCWISI